MAAYKDKEHRTWYVKFNYTDWTGKRRTTTKRGFATKAEALEYEHDFKLRSKSSIDITVKDLADRYLADYQISHKRSSYVYVQYCINQYILPKLKDMRLNDLSPFILKEWQNNLSSHNFADNTMHGIASRLSAMLNFAVKYLGLPSNPYNKVDKIGATNGRMRFLELSEFQRMITAVQDEYDKLVFTLLFFSGMRISELLGLHYEDFDFSLNTISVNKQYNYNLRYYDTPKTKFSNRVITMPQSIMHTTKEYFDKFYTPPECPFIVKSPLTLRYSLTNAVKKAGLPHISLHDLRHSHASYLIHNNMPITAISKRLGHASVKMTLDCYSHCYKNNDIEIANLLETVCQNVVKEK